MEFHPLALLQGGLTTLIRVAHALNKPERQCQGNPQPLPISD